MRLCRLCAMRIGPNKFAWTHLVSCLTQLTSTLRTFGSTYRCCGWTQSCVTSRCARVRICYVLYMLSCYTACCMQISRREAMSRLRSAAKGGDQEVASFIDRVHAFVLGWGDTVDGSRDVSALFSNSIRSSPSDVIAAPSSQQADVSCKGMMSYRIAFITRVIC
jgi:hypothetical protein